MMSGMKLTFWPEAALGIFLATFVAIAVRTYSKRHAAEYDRAMQLPFDEKENS